MLNFKSFKLLSRVSLLALVLCSFLLLSCDSTTDVDDDPTPDTTVPSLPILSPEDGAMRADANWTFSGTAADNVGVTSISWTASTGATGTVAGDLGTWSVDIPLEVGFISLTFTAKDAAGNATTATVSINHTNFLEMTSALDLSPNAAVNSIQVQLAVYAPLDPSSVGATEERTLTELALVIAGDDLVVDEVLGTLTDDGNLGNGDEIEGDNIYTLTGNMTFASSGDIPLRIRATYETPDRAVVEDFTVAQILQVVDTPADGETQIVADLGMSGFNYFDTLVGSGMPLPEAADSTVEHLSGEPDIATTGTSADKSVVWYETEAGLRGNIVLNPDGTRGGARVGTSERGGALISSPYAWDQVSDRLTEIGDNDVMIYDAYNSQFAPHDEGPFLNELFSNSECPVFEVDYFIDGQCTVDLVTTFPNYGTIILVTHGGRDQGEVFFMTREIVTEASQDENLVDLVLHNLIISTVGGIQYFSILPGFIEGVGDFSEAIVYNGSCESSANSTMADAFLDNGAEVYLGFTRVVNSDFAQAVCEEFFENMVTWGDDSGEAFTAGQVDPTAPNATFTMQSNDTAEYVEDLINGSFEEGDLTGWSASGDGRVITGLGSTGPTDGVFMGIISTGLGYTVSSGSITASICSPDATGELTLSFDWNFFSEEFLEWCGSQYQDFFQVVAIIDGMETELMYLKIDDLCDSVTASDVSFDQSGVYDTGWQSSSFTLPTLTEGQTLLISFRAGDVGDSIYDSAILIDNVVLE